MPATMQCCGEARHTPFCPLCGTQLLRPFDAWLYYCRDRRRQAEQSGKQAKDGKLSKRALMSMERWKRFEQLAETAMKFESQIEELRDELMDTKKKLARAERQVPKKQMPAVKPNDGGKLIG